jgi:glutamate racemase
VDTVILGCTHYPLLIKPIASFLGEEVSVVECSKAIAHDVQRILGSEGESQSRPSTTEYFVTDAVGQFNQLAGIFLGDRRVQAVRIESLF